MKEGRKERRKVGRKEGRKEGRNRVVVSNFVLGQRNISNICMVKPICIMVAVFMLHLNERMIE
jgi:hypothetical protein